MPLPTLFREALACAGMPAIDEWWAHLDAPARADALQLWHECSQAESGLTVRVEARIADDDTAEPGDFWHNDFYDYLVNHEVYLLDAPTLHVCTQQPAAAAAVRAGFIPHDFACPLATPACAMRRLLAHASGRSVRLRVSVVAAAPGELKTRWLSPCKG